MNVAVVGAGAVGCYYGFLLARAGHAVTLIGRPALVEVVEKDGLVLESAAGTASVPVRATDAGAGVSGADLVLVCVKSGDTEAAGAMIAPHLDPAATVLSLQNGVDNAERLAAVLGRPVVPVAVYVATAMAGPGHVRHNGRGDLILGASETSARVAAAFAAAGIPTTVSAKAVDALWAKLIINCAYNALSALTQLPYGRLVEGDGVAAVIADVVQECARVAEAEGVSVSPRILDDVMALSAAMAGQRSSTAQDLARGRPSEIDHLNGTIVRRGAAHGIPTPVNRLLHALVKLAERRD
ncbi:ketopantoate reductase family protein [Methylobacterium radiotolerans]|uniref:2-dehydropantoate 2-reductase n=1 Tax=Methylobacterium radiotolerans (strain ATCC 27329 / DSM 1819 / JCM 2831 / NBRC 15690 / NCIMB 10815 / 0-1) TaxID=426355 RepID=B1LUV9_METRJ|nr:2-dehydropantoate 2-reductase [Methylobacterium radiotolerans]ACB25545.1 2-dehydropantoate 2-reductase [Methylobacterium radiotolerans JCM 2831]